MSTKIDGNTLDYKYVGNIWKRALMKIEINFGKLFHETGMVKIKQNTNKFFRINTKEKKKFTKHCPMKKIIKILSKPGIFFHINFIYSASCINNYFSQD